MVELKENAKKMQLLLWKQYKLRVNRWFLSLLELLLPIAIVALLLQISTDNSRGMEDVNATIFPESSTYDLVKSYNFFKRIIYTPQSPALELLMTQYSKFLKGVATYPIQTNIIGVQNESILEIMVGECNNTTDKCIGIVFDDVSALVSGNGKFSYTLRSDQDLQTDKLYYSEISSSSNMNMPVIDDAYLLRGFTAVQAALNEAFFGYRNESPVYEKMYLRAFPHPGYENVNELRVMVPTIICFIVLLTTFILATPLITTIIEEKISGVKELMKIVGMKEWLIWLGWFIHALIFSLISYTIVTCMLQHEYFGPNSALIRNVNPFLLWCCIILYCIANIAFCFTFTALFHQGTVASTVYFLSVVLLVFGNSYLSEMKFMYLRKIACLFPTVAFSLAFDRIKFTEVHDVYLGWSNLFSPGTSTLSLGYTFLMMILDTFLYLFLAYYIGAINPGKFGVRKSPFFIFYPLMSALKRNEVQKLVNLEDSAVDRFIEKAPSNLEASIKIKDLHKNFGSVYAVKGVDLNVYKGEITALLGHNGAGKTTTLAILTGIIKPTSGSIVYKDKLNVLKEMDDFRQHLGMCPQEDRLFPYLTVLDHLLFFGQLKGASQAEALKEAKEYMKLMEIESKASSLVASLSGGMKRKLCLSIALMGKAETLILDEPTSGLDVESRRKLWDLLLEMRGSRTIILTTHHMEEADALGDRIAIMHHGTIVCHGTSLFLKKSYNTGYQVTVTKSEDISDRELTNILQNSGVPDVSLEGASPTEVVYKLPLTETSKFSRMFQQLEMSKGKLGYKSIGVSCTTMEQVFLKVGGASVYDPLSTSRKGSTVTDGGTVSKFVLTKSSGFRLIGQQIFALLRKKLLYVSRNYMNFFFRVILPSLVTMVLVHNAQVSSPSEKSLQIDYSLYPNMKVMIQNTSDSWPMWETFQTQFEPYGIKLIASEGTNVVEGLLKYSQADLDVYKHDLILAMEQHGQEEKRITLLYNRFALHSLPLGLNVFANNMIRYRENTSTEFVMTSHPLIKFKEKCGGGMDENFYPMLILWFIVLAFFTIDLNTYFITSINVERLSGFKHIQLMSGVSPLTYWLSNFLFDSVFFFIIVFARIVLFKLLGDVPFDFLDVDYHFFVFLSILILFIASSLPFTYVMSYLSNSRDGSYLLIFILNILGSVTAAVLFGFEKFFQVSGFNFWTMLYYVAKYLVLLFPPMNYGMIFIKFFYTWSFHKTCLACQHLHPEVPCPAYSYFVSDSESSQGVSQELSFLLFDLMLYSALLSVIQLGYFEQLVNNLLILIYGSSANRAVNVSVEGDTDVKAEKADVQRSVSSGTSFNTENVLTAYDLRKNFIKMLRTFTAVADVNFKVKAGECFGLLGVNGAGKSTTFRMLTGDLLPTKGDSWILNSKLSTNRTEYLSKAGYCPQSNCFLEELTGREMLSLVASLRGIKSINLKETVDKWLGTLGLEEYQSQRCGDYSGGNKRKLCTAMSLIGDPSVVFLDEPTSGVDPVARRRLYNVMEESRKSGQAVVLTSHSMEECENLCDRLTILVKGRMQCIGTAQHLKQTYAQGFSILVKISDAATRDELSLLKERIVNEFNRQCTLKDEHKTRLYYQITNTNLLWSTLFDKMELLKANNRNVVEDYSLSDTSLEEVFISFAKSSYT